MRYILPLLLFAGSAFGAPPKVEKTKYDVPPGQMLRISVDGKDLGMATSFTDEEALFDEFRDRGDGVRRFVFQSQKPGIYTVTLWTVNEKTGVILTITVTGATPPLPPVPPGPQPKPPEPVPSGKKLTLIVIEETAKRTPTDGKVLFDKEFRAWLAANKGEMELLDANSPQVTTNNYKQFVDAVGLPTVLAFDADVSGPQKPLAAFKLPGTAAELRLKCEGK